MNREKLLAKARNNPKGLRFEELCQLAEAYGWRLGRITGSHHIFKRPGIAERINIQRLKDGKAKPVQVREVLTLIDKYNDEETA